MRPPDVTRVYNNLVVLPFDRIMLNLFYFSETTFGLTVLCSFRFVQ